MIQGTVCTSAVVVGERGMFRKVSCAGFDAVSMLHVNI